MGTMEIGLRIPHTGWQATPEFVRSWCALADEAGFGSVWGADHMVMPRHVESKYVLPRKPATIAEDAVSDLLSPNFELTTTMAFVAAVTNRIKIGSSVAVLSIRNAVLNARQLATVDRYSGGRVVYGVGVGWLKEEADAMNMPWDRRGARADEHIALLRAIWTAPGKHVEFHGEFWDIPAMDPRAAAGAAAHPYSYRWAQRGRHRPGGASRRRVDRGRHVTRATVGASAPASRRRRPPRPGPRLTPDPLRR